MSPDQPLNPLEDLSAPARILVADDEISIRLGCEKILAAEGWKVTTVEDGLSAVSAFEAEPFDLVLLDLRMPGLDGLGAISRIRKMDPTAIIVMITGYASFETAVKAIQDGAYDYVPKPFTPNELRIVVKRCLEKRALILRNRRLQQERERSLKDLALEKSRTRAIINAMADPLMVVNAAGELVLFNPAAKTFLQDSLEKPGVPLSRAVSLPALAESFQAACSRLDSRVTAATTEVEDSDHGKTYMMNVAAIPAQESAESSGTVMVLSDITPMKDLERTKSRFVSIVAHELKAPVAAIEGYLDLILPDLTGPLEQYKAKIERCRDRANLLQKLIRELLDLSRIEQGRIERNLEAMDPCPIIEETREFLMEEAGKKRVKIETIPAGKPFKIMGDRTEISQIFTNLLSNAIKYNRNGGSITIRHSVTGGTWRSSVIDTGMGISPDHISHIGEEFFRVKNSQTVQISGTGLGMAIVKRLLDLNSAQLEIKSVLGEGSTFTVCWPLPD